MRFESLVQGIFVPILSEDLGQKRSGHVIAFGFSILHLDSNALYLSLSAIHTAPVVIFVVISGQLERRRSRWFWQKINRCGQQKPFRLLHFYTIAISLSCFK
jgi:hypothetical protein